jgi:hypothetical protein
MIIVLGLIILVAVVVAGVSGVLSNSGGGHAVTHFAMFGYHVTGSTGTLFLYGIVLGAVGLFGLSLLTAGARRTSRRGSEARRGLRQSRRETAAASQQRDDLIDQRDTARAQTASQERDDLIDQRDTARAQAASAQTASAQTASAQTASAQDNAVPSGNGHASADGGRPGWRQLLGQRSAPEQPASDPPAPADDPVAVSQP